MGGLRREVLLYLPRNVSSNPPLLLLFHGTGGAGDIWFSDTDTRSVADTAGAVAIAPTSQWMSGGDWDHDGESGYWATYPRVNVSTNADLQLVQVGGHTQLEAIAIISKLIRFQLVFLKFCL